MNGQGDSSMKEQVDKQRTEWLRLAKRIATHLLERWELVENDLSPSNRQRTNERQAALNRVKEPKRPRGKSASRTQLSGQ